MTSIATGFPGRFSTITALSACHDSNSTTVMDVHDAQRQWEPHLEGDQDIKTLVIYPTSDCYSIVAYMQATPGQGVLKSLLVQTRGRTHCSTADMQGPFVVNQSL